MILRCELKKMAYLRFALLILMKENPSNLGHCSLTCCLRFHFWSLGFPLQWASVKVTRCSGWVVVGCCADELLPLALAGWGSCTEHVFYCIMLERNPIFGNISQSSLILYQIQIMPIASSHGISCALLKQEQKCPIDARSTHCHRDCRKDLILFIIYTIDEYWI